MLNIKTFSPKTRKYTKGWLYGINRNNGGGGIPANAVRDNANNLVYDNSNNLVLDNS